MAETELPVSSGVPKLDQTTGSPPHALQMAENPKGVWTGHLPFRWLIIPRGCGVDRASAIQKVNIEATVPKGGEMYIGCLVLCASKSAIYFEILRNSFFSRKTQYLDIPTTLSSYTCTCTCTCTCSRRCRGRHTSNIITQPS